MFVSAGDDTVIKVFNFRQRKLLFTLNGHLDYVRSLAFHHEAPWIVSASDDQTIRIWNWQSRQCVAVLSGHNHYVMCAAFHPTEDLLVSGSLDQTIRVWDLSTIRAKNAPSMASATSRKPSLTGSGSTSPQIDLFAGSGLETSVKFIMEGHERGVNWVQFHPTKPLIISGSDDRSVKIWRYNDVRAWEVENFRGHSNNVSAAMWHPRADLVFSDAEDRQLRIWDCSSATSSNGNSTSGRGKCLLTIKRDHDRFWCLAAHPELNMFAAGHDNGLVLFKLDRERPAYTLTEGPEGDVLYYVRDRIIRSFPLDTGKEADELVTPLDAALRLPASLGYSQTERSLIAVSNISLDSRGSAIQLRDKSRPSLPFNGVFATFVSRNRFVTLTPQGILLQGIGETSTKQLPSPSESANITRLLPGPLGSFLAVTSGMVYLMDGNSGRVIGSLEVCGVKYASWSANFEHCALISKKAVHLTDKSFSRISHVHSDNTGIKSGVWDLSGPGPIFYYTNSFHLKYLLPFGDSGIICTTSNPLYLIRVKGDLVHVLDRQLSVLVLAIDPTECHFKMALNAGDTGRINHIIETSNLVGQAVISYLRDKGHAEIALQFVKDPVSRFELALECCDLKSALESAIKINESATWNQLANEALLIGDLNVAKEALKRAKNNTRASFINLLTGDFNGMLSPSEGSSNASMMSAILGNDNRAAVELLSQNGLNCLAHLFGTKRSVPAGAELGRFAASQPVTSMAPVNKSTNWPLLFDPVIKASSSCTTKIETGTSSGPSAGWAADLDEFEDPFAGQAEGADLMFGDQELDIQLDDDDLALFQESSNLGADLFDLEFPTELPLPRPQSQPVDAQTLCEHIRASNNLTSLTPAMQSAVNQIVAGQSVFVNFGFGGHQVILPAEFTSLNLNEGAIFDSAMQFTTQGKFAEALPLFQSFLQLCAVSGTSDAEDFVTARNYIIGLFVDLKRKEAGEADLAHAIDLSVLFTRVALKPEHHLLSLRSTLALAYKAAAYRTAALIARRIVSLPAPEAVHLQARKVLSVAEKANYSEAVEGIRFGTVGGADDSAWIIDPLAFCRIEEGSPAHECLFCGTKYSTAVSTCAVCEIGQIQ